MLQDEEEVVGLGGGILIDLYIVMWSQGWFQYFWGLSYKLDY